MKKSLLIALSLAMLVMVPACMNKNDSSNGSKPPKAKKERKVSKEKKVKKVKKTTTDNGYGTKRTEEVVTEDTVRQNKICIPNMVPNMMIVS